MSGTDFGKGVGVTPIRINFVANFRASRKKAQHSFPKRGGGGQRPFGSFPKIHQKWSTQSSLTSVANHKYCECNFVLFTQPWAQCHSIWAPRPFVENYLRQKRMVKAHQSGFQPFCNPVPHRQRRRRSILEFAAEEVLAA